MRKKEIKHEWMNDNRLQLGESNSSYTQHTYTHKHFISSKVRKKPNDYRIFNNNSYHSSKIQTNIKTLIKKTHFYTE